MRILTLGATFLLLAVSSAFHAAAQEPETSQLELFIQTTEELRDFNTACLRGGNLTSYTDERWTQTEQTLASAAKKQAQLTICDDGILVYMQGVVAVFRKEFDSAYIRDYLPKITSPMELESLELVKRQIPGEAFKHEDSAGFEYPAYFIPFCGSGSWTYGTGEDASMSARPLYFPSAYVDKPMKVSCALMNLGYYDKAWRSFYESISESSWLDPRGVLGEEAAEYWFLAGECAYRAGEERLGWNLLMKAGVFGDDALLERVKETAARWANGEANDVVLSQGAPDKEDRYANWTTIINAYVKMNAHPRAWELIDEYRDEFESPPKPWVLKDMIQMENDRIAAPNKDEEYVGADDLKKRIQDDWNNLIDSGVSRCEFQRGKWVKVYGQVLLQKTGEDENGDPVFERPVKPLDVTIPWAFPEGGVERAKAELLNKLDNYESSEKRE